MYISPGFYQQVITVVPICCVDIILRSESGYLLVERVQEPLKGQLWVVGGRVHIGETLLDSALRKLREEIALIISPDKLNFVGVYEDIFDRSSFGEHPYHTISIVYEVVIDEKINLIPDKTIGCFKFANKLPDRFISNLRKCDKCEF